MMVGNRAKTRFLRLAQEPMATFVLAGGLLFWTYTAATLDDASLIEIPDGYVSQVVAEREFVLERRLTATEVEAIRQDLIDQEVLVREAVARNLFLNDGRIRHRLADKMYYLLADDIGEPTQADLEEFFENHKSDYRTPELFSFTHLFYGRDELRAHNALPADGVILDQGVDFYLGNDIERYARTELLPIFGVDFANALGDLPAGQWQGPIASGRGWHLVRVEAHESPRQLSREEIGDRLFYDWRDWKSAVSRRASLDTLRANYRIVEHDAGSGN